MPAMRRTLAASAVACLGAAALGAVLLFEATSVPSDPGPLAGSWRAIGPTATEGARTFTFTPGQVAHDGTTSRATYEVSPDRRKAVVRRAGQPDLTLDLSVTNVASGPDGQPYLLRIVR